MKHVIITLVLSLTLSLSAAAAESPVEKTAPGDASAEYCDASECGALPAEGTSPTAGGDTPNGECIRSTNYETCIARCDCQYTKNKKDCGRSAWCIDIATSERNACYGNCIADWS